MKPIFKHLGIHVVIFSCIHICLLSELAQSRSNETVSKFIKMLSDTNRTAINHAKDSLVRIGPSVIHELVRILQDSSTNLTLRKRSLWVLSGFDQEAAIALPIIKKILKDSTDDFDMQYTAINICGSIGPAASEMVPELIKLLSHPRFDTYREAAAKALGKIGPGAKDAVPDLIRLMKQDWKELVRMEAEIALGKIGTPAVEELLKQFTNKSESHFLRAKIVGIFTYMGPKAKKALLPLITAINDTNEAEDVRFNAAEAIGEIGSGAEEAILPLIRLMIEKGGYGFASGAARRSLIKIGKPVVPPLIKLIVDRTDSSFTSRRRRVDAVYVIGEIRPAEKEVATLLVNILSDTTRIVDSLGIWEFYDYEVKHEAINALGKLGIHAENAIPILTKYLGVTMVNSRDLALTSLVRIAESFQDAKNVNALPVLQAVYDTATLIASRRQYFNTQENKEEIGRFRRALQALELINRETIFLRLLRFYEQNKLVSNFIMVLLFFFFISSVLYWVKPLWVFRINNSLKSVSDLNITISIFSGTFGFRHILLIGFFHHRPRVLDAWVRVKIAIVDDRFRKKITVHERTNHVDVPVVLNNNPPDMLTVKNLRPAFLDKRICLFIWGEGGSGKTSLACLIAKWATEEKRSFRLIDKHPMIPILIEQDIDPHTTINEDPLLSHIRGELRNLTNSEDPIDKEFVIQLLRQRRLLVIVDGLSEMNETTRGIISSRQAEFPVNALVVTSRLEENLGGAPKSTIKPLRLESTRLSTFLHEYLTKQGKRELFEDNEFFSLCGKLTQLVGDRNITVLLAKLYAEHMIASKERSDAHGLPNSIPELMLRYLNDLNRSATANDPDDRTIHRISKKIAWECLNEFHRPTQVMRDQVKTVLSDEGNAESLLKYLEEKLGLIQVVGVGKNKIRFSLDPLAEYMAGLHLISLFGDNEESWRNLLRKTDEKPGAPENIKGFLFALRDCVIGNVETPSIPAFVADDLTKKVGLDPEVVEQSRFKQRMKRLIFNLTVPEVEDRLASLLTLIRIGPKTTDAVPVLVQCIRDPDEEIRFYAVRALGKIGTEARAAIPDLIKSLSDTVLRVRIEAVKTLAEVGTEAKAALPNIISLFLDPNDIKARREIEDRRLHSDYSNQIFSGLPFDELLDIFGTADFIISIALKLIDKKGEVTIPLLIEALQSKEPNSRTAACIAIAIYGPDAKAAEPLLQALLQDSDLSVQEAAKDALKHLG